MSVMDGAHGFYRPGAAGTVVCVLCAAVAPTHALDCPVRTMDAHVRELTAQLGLLVAQMRETTEALERLLRGDGHGDAGT
jgi:hypothetical protein